MKHFRLTFYFVPEMAIPLFVRSPQANSPFRDSSRNRIGPRWPATVVIGDLQIQRSVVRRQGIIFSRNFL